jgi:hypothetical protein
VRNDGAATDKTITRPTVVKRIGNAIKRVQICFLTHDVAREPLKDGTLSLPVKLRVTHHFAKLSDDILAIEAINLFIGQTDELPQHFPCVRAKGRACPPNRSRVA